MPTSEPGQVVKNTAISKDDIASFSTLSKFSTSKKDSSIRA